MIFSFPPPSFLHRIVFPSLFFSLNIKQNLALNNRFLTGGRGSDNYGVRVDNPTEDSTEKSATKTYQWIISNEFTSGDLSNAFECAPFTNSTAGRWTQIGLSPSTVSISQGYQVTNEQSYSATNTWSQTLTLEASAGFEFEGVSASTTTSVSSTYSSSVTQGMSQAFQKSFSISQKVDFTQPGQCNLMIFVDIYLSSKSIFPTGFSTNCSIIFYFLKILGVVWEWVTNANDVCGHSVNVYSGTYLVQTASHQDYRKYLR